MNPRYETAEQAWAAMPLWRNSDTPKKDRVAAVAQWVDKLNGFWNNQFHYNLQDAPHEMCDFDRILYAMHKLDARMWLHVHVKGGRR